MSGRRYKPALYELVNRGPLKPDKKGSLRTPSWFYGEERGGAGVQTPPATTSAPGARSAASPGGTVPVMGQPGAGGGVSPRARSSFAFETAHRHVAMMLPYWAAALVVLGLLFSWAVFYRLGVGSGRGQAETPASVGSVDTPAAPEVDERLREVARSQPRPEVLGSAQPSGAESGTGAGPAGSTPVRSTETPRYTAPIAGSPGAVEPPASQGANVLVLCGTDNRRNLMTVQEFFTRQGFLTEIGRTGGRYVLYTAEGSDSINSQQAQQFKRTAAQLGARYNTEKPAGAPIFTPNTFASAYWIRRDAVALGD